MKAETIQRFDLVTKNPFYKSHNFLAKYSFYLGFKQIKLWSYLYRSLRIHMKKIYAEKAQIGSNCVLRLIPLL